MRYGSRRLKKSRILVIFTGFLLVVFFGSILLIKLTSKNEAPRPPQEKAPEEKEPIHRVFYNSIGTEENDEDTPTIKGLPSEDVSLEKFTIELAAFSDRQKAEHFVEKLEKEGVDSYYTPLQHGPSVVYRVRTGVFSKREQAEAVAKQMKAEKKLGATVIKLE